MGKTAEEYEEEARERAVGREREIITALERIADAAEKALPLLEKIAAGAPAPLRLAVDSYAAPDVLRDNGLGGPSRESPFRRAEKPGDQCIGCGGVVLSDGSGIATLTHGPHCRGNPP